ncbi:MAG: ABC transporter permease [Planctomycetota bacterium]|jgi:lipoprotein-releasing system permease protein
MLKLFLWLRYLRKKRIVLLSIAAVAVSTALLIVVSSLFIGFIDAFQAAAVSAMGDVVLAPPPPLKIAEYREFIEHLEQLDAVQAATATLSSQGLLYLGKGNVRAVKIWGIEPASRAKVTGFKQALIKQKHGPGQPSFEADGTPKISGFVGIGVITEPDEKTDEYDLEAIEADTIGQKVVLITGTRVEPEGPATAQGDKRFKRKNIPFTVADIVFTGVYYLDKHFVYLPLEQLQNTLGSGQAGADQIQIKLARPAKVETGLAQIRGLWETFASEQLGWNQNAIRYTSIETSKAMQSQYVAGLWKQLWILLLIFGVVSFGVVLLVFCIFYMIVLTKQKDIAIVRSCGAASGSVTSIFVGFGGCAGIIGSAVGTALGYAVIRNINTIEEWIRVVFGLKLWKSSIYMFSKIPSQIYWGPTLLIVLSALAAVSAGALIPAVLAAWTRPVDILRCE